MRLIILYLLVFAMCAPQISGASTVVSVSVDDHAEHAYAALEVGSDQSTKHGDCGGDSKQSVVVTPDHSCCEDGNYATASTQCCDHNCDGCNSDCSSSSLALMSTVNSPALFASSKQPSLSSKLPDPPNQSALIPPIA